ncbi:MAG: hypothetical protein Q9193_006941 [Seirophora villosa]
MAPFDFYLYNESKSSSNSIAVKVPEKPQQSFQPSSQSLKTEASATEEPTASAMPKACDSDEDLPELDHLLMHHLPSKRPAAMNLDRANGPTLGPAPPPTPMTTPVKTRQQAPGHARSPRRTAPTATTLTLNFKPTSQTTPPGSKKRPMDSISASPDDEPITTPSKRIRSSRRITTAPPTAMPSPPPTPVSINNKKNKISSFEINRVRASVMKRVNWKKVAKDVACNRSARVYQRGVKRVFDAWMRETVAEEGKGD